MKNAAPGIAAFILAAALVLNGCGESPSSKQPGGDQAADSIAGDKSTSHDAGAPGGATASSGDRPMREATPEETAALNALLAETDALTEQAQFSLATKKLQSRQDDFAEHPRRDEIQQRITWLYTARREGPNVRYAIEKLTADDLGTRMMVEQQIRTAGRLGQIMLAQAVRNMAAPEAAKAAELLGEMDAPFGPSAIIDRLTTDPPETAEQRDVMGKALARLAKHIQPQDIRTLAAGLGNDPHFEKRALVTGLGEVVRVQLDGEPAGLNNLAQQPGLDKRLAEYVASAWQQGKDDPQLREWAAAVGAQFNVHVPGIHGMYFSGGDLNAMIFERRDSVLQFDGITSFALPGELTLEAFSARYEGKVKVETAGEYAFIIWSSDGQRLWINDKLLIDKWQQRTPPQVARVNLEPGLHDFKLEYRQTTGPASLTARWTGPGIDQALLDMTFLRTLPWEGMNVTP